MFTRESSIQLRTRHVRTLFLFTKTIGDRNCTACFSLANIFNQSTNKSFGAKLQSEVTGGFTQVRVGYLINQSATSCAISIPLCSKTVLIKKYKTRPR